MESIDRLDFKDRIFTPPGPLSAVSVGAGFPRPRAPERRPYSQIRIMRMAQAASFRSHFPNANFREDE